MGNISFGTELRVQTKSHNSSINSTAANLTELKIHQSELQPPFSENLWLSKFVHTQLNHSDINVECTLQMLSTQQIPTPQSEKQQTTNLQPSLLSAPEVTLAKHLSSSSMAIHISH